MASIHDFTFANGLLTVTCGASTDNFYSTDFRAKSREDKVVIFPINQDDNNKYVQKDWEYPYDELTCQGVAYASAEDFVTIFNALAGSSIGFNTKYPETLFSQNFTIDTSVDEQVVPIWCITGRNAGYVILTTPSTNTANVYVGEDDVSDVSYILEPDKSITLEMADLSQIWVRCETPLQNISVIGVAKT